MFFGLNKKCFKATNNNGDHLGYMIFCPACQEHHLFDGRWTFDGDEENPTFRPSMLIRSGHYADKYKQDMCWCTYNAQNPDKEAPFVCSVCHSFVTNGKIEFLSDCTHSLAGKTVELPIKGGIADYESF